MLQNLDFYIIQWTKMSRAEALVEKSTFRYSHRLWVRQKNTVSDFLQSWGASCSWCQYAAMTKSLSGPGCVWLPILWPISWPCQKGCCIHHWSINPADLWSAEAPVINLNCAHCIYSLWQWRQPLKTFFQGDRNRVFVTVKIFSKESECIGVISHVDKGDSLNYGCKRAISISHIETPEYLQQWPR